LQTALLVAGAFGKPGIGVAELEQREDLMLDQFGWQPPRRIEPQFGLEQRLQR
jgi:hypothetical protein